MGVRYIPDFQSLELVMVTPKEKTILNHNSISIFFRMNKSNNTVVRFIEQNWSNFCVIYIKTRILVVLL